MFKTLLTADALVTLAIPARAMDADARARMHDRWEAEDRGSKINRRLRALEDDAVESREERTGPIYLNNGACIWSFGNNVSGKCWHGQEQFNSPLQLLALSTH